MIDAIEKALEAMAHSPVRNYATPGLTSSLVGGNGHGCVRLFESDRNTREWVTPHSHRFDFVCVVLAGEVENILFVHGYGEPMNAFAKATLRPVSGGLGKYEVVRSGERLLFGEVPRTYKAGESYSMRAHEIHSIRFSRGARVLFFEGPNVTDESVILEPYSNGRTVPTFEARSWMFEREPTQSNSEGT